MGPFTSVCKAFNEWFRQCMCEGTAVAQIVESAAETKGLAGSDVRSLVQSSVSSFNDIWGEPNLGLKTRRQNPLTPDDQGGEKKTMKSWHNEVVALCLLVSVCLSVGAGPICDSEALETCTTVEEVGCFSDVPAHPVNAVLVSSEYPDGYASGEWCMKYCALYGYTYYGLTAHPPPSEEYFCRCGQEIDTASKPAPMASCNVTCPETPTSNCGGLGFTWLGKLNCKIKPNSPLPPNTTALPSGPACSQPESKGWAFCNTSLDLDTRVWDLVDRIALTEAGPLLTSRESPAISRLGLPAFYWGTNAIHGVRENAVCLTPTKCPTSFPDGINMALTWNMSNVENMGRVIGREMRVMANLGYSNDGLVAWAPTINVIRDPRWGRNQETASEGELET